MLSNNRMHLTGRGQRFVFSRDHLSATRRELRSRRVPASDAGR